MCTPTTVQYRHRIRKSTGQQCAVLTNAKMRPTQTSNFPSDRRPISKSDAQATHANKKELKN